MIWQDAGENELTVSGCPDGHAAFTVTGKDGKAVTVCVKPHWLPDITMEAYRAAGQVPPVMLGRPDVDPDEGCSCGAVMLRRAPGGVMVAIGGNSEVLGHAATRRLAAAAVALADGPDPGEVGAVAALIGGDCPGGAAAARQAARRLLAAGYRREDAR